MQLARDDGHRGKKFCGLLDGQFEHLVDAFTFVIDFERFAVVAQAVTDIAGNIDIRQEVHFDLDHAVALTGLAAPALDVEGETPRPVTAFARV